MLRPCNTRRQRKSLLSKNPDKKRNSHPADSCCRAGKGWKKIRLQGGVGRYQSEDRLASKASVLLLDEPLGALDALTRLEMQKLIEEIWLFEKFTAVLVTHDVEEAAALADRVLVMEEGRIIAESQTSLPRPRDRSSSDFIMIRETLLGWVMHGTKSR
jgi:sulfonate transport system ATP-binding protein